MVEVIVVILALLAGVLARGVNLPPMVGFLVAGFTLIPLQQFWPEITEIDFKPLVSIGVTLLLFCIGLKLQLQTLLRPFVWAVTCIHMSLLIVLCFALLFALKSMGWALVAGLSMEQSLTIGFALSFSSTVFAVKVLENRGEMASLHGKAAIGVLVMQDIFAVAYLSMISGTTPSMFAPLVLLLIPAKSLLVDLLRRCGHSELLVLAGFAIAYAGYGLFEAVGLKGDLGALFIGAVLASSDKGKELAKSLLTIKDVLLIGFFLSIGQYGLPSGDAWLMALMLLVFVVLKPTLFFVLFTRFKLRAQTSFFGALALNHYSEFGLIVLAIAMQQGVLPDTWVVILALSLSLSFILSSLINVQSDKLYAGLTKQLQHFETSSRVAEQRPIDIGNAEILVMGMGRLGTGVYDYLHAGYNDTLVGFEESLVKVKEHTKVGRRVLVGDASDRDLWQRLSISQVKQIFLALSNHRETVLVTNLLRESGYDGVIAAVAKFDDNLEELKALGVIAFNFYSEAGAGFAEHVVNHKDFCLLSERSQAS
ncbi:cation:proton antiporter family protein [Oceanicoccus sp. KOV_DT_Chl]|uniref:cation:proton antiporter family protein n=1 Tax=Oceanicoccus sp. KOV_DT_Chl TaxID=1904639 RepID=UPI000C7CA7B6|nr:cation:proton antiporter family protein [Oceanicoccus sp. KOV_DT_Chl]